MCFQNFGNYDQQKNPANHYFGGFKFFLTPFENFSFHRFRRGKKLISQETYF